MSRGELVTWKIMNISSLSHMIPIISVFVSAQVYYFARRSFMIEVRSKMLVDSAVLNNIRESRL